MFIKLKNTLWFLFLLAPVVHAEPALLVMGDSLSAEYGLATGSGWAALLQKKLVSEGHRIRVINASISGETSTGGRARIRDALATYHPQWVILALGANDGLRGQPVNILRDNLQSIIELCRRDGAKVLLVGQRLPPNYGQTYSDHFEATFREVARRSGAALVPFMLAGFETDRTLFQQDGLHPTAAAQPRIVDNIYPKLKPLLSK